MRALIDLSLGIFPYDPRNRDAASLFKGLALDPEIQATGLIYSRYRRSMGRRLYWGKHLDRRLHGQSQLLGSMTSADPEAGLLPKILANLREFCRARLKSRFHLQPLIKDHLFDIVWRNYLHPLFEQEDYELLKSQDYVLCEITADTYIDRLNARRNKPLLVTEGYDAIIFPDVTPVRASPGTRKIVRLHDMNPPTPPDRLQNSYHFRAVESCLKNSWFACTSAATLRGLKSAFREAEGRASVIHGAISSFLYPETNPTRLKQIFECRSVVPGKVDAEGPPLPYFLAVSTGEPGNNHLRLFEAFEEILLKADVRLVVVGAEGCEKQEILKQMERLAAENRLLWLNGASPQEMRLIYSSSLALVNVSVADGFSYSGVEAMKCSTAVIASNIAAHREIYRSQAFYCDPQAAHTIAAGMRRVWFHRNSERGGMEKRLAWGIRIAASFTIEHLAEQWKACLKGETLPPARPLAAKVEAEPPEMIERLERGGGKASSIYFLHIMKSAGTSVRTLLENSFSYQEVFQGHYTQAYKKLPPSSPPYVFFRGHTGMDVLPKLPAPTDVVIWLRDPARRLLSYFSFQKQQCQIPGTMKLEEWLETMEEQSTLGAIWDGNENSGSIDTGKKIHRVLCFLESCRVVGLVEENDVSVHLLCHRMGLLPPPIPTRFNVSANPGYEKKMTPQEWELLNKASEGDRELYDKARSLFQMQLQDMDAELGGQGPLSWESRQSILTRRFWEKNQQPWQDEITYTFDQPLIGWGWYDREFEAGKGGPCFRWMGAPPESVIWLPMCRSRTARVSLRIHGSLAGPPPEVLRLSGGKAEAVLRASHPAPDDPTETLMVWEVPPDSEVKPGVFTPLRFQVSKVVRPIDFDPGTFDARSLGVSLNRIEIQPA